MPAPVQQPGAKSAWGAADDAYWDRDNVRVVGSSRDARERILHGDHNLGLTPQGFDPGQPAMWGMTNGSGHFQQAPSPDHTAPVAPVTPHTLDNSVAGQPLPPQQGAAALQQRDQMMMRQQADSVMAGYRNPQQGAQPMPLTAANSTAIQGGQVQGHPVDASILSRRKSTKKEPPKELPKKQGPIDASILSRGKR